MFGDGSINRQEIPAVLPEDVGPAPFMGDKADTGLFNVSELVRLGLKHKLILIGCLLIAVLLGALATLLMTPKYLATATLQIDRESARVLDVAEVAPREAMVAGEEFFQTQYGLLRSRSLAERVTESLGLAQNNAFLEAMGSSFEDREGETAQAKARRRREEVLNTIDDNLTVSPVRGSRLVNVSFESPDPQLSARIVNAFGESFIQANLDRRFESSKYARQFLEERIAQTKARLEDAERSLVAYATNQQIINLPSTDDAEGRSLDSESLLSINNALSNARANRVAAEEKWRQAQSASINNIPEVLGNPVIQRLTEQRAVLDATYRQKLSLYQPDYPEMVQIRSQIAELDSQINTVARGIRDSIRGQYLVAANQERSLQRQVSGLRGDVLDLQNRSIQYNILRREVDTTRVLYDGLLQRYKEVGVTGAISTNNISIVDPARVPDQPSKPRMLFNLIIAALFGLGLGIVVVFLLEALNETLSTPEDVESKLRIPTLGIVPLLEKDVSAVESLDNTKSGFAEAYYSVRTAIQFSTPHGAPNTLLVTSTQPAEGKSTTAYAVALNLARLGKRVLLLDTDLRNPSMHRTLGLSNEGGMSNLLSGGAAIADVVQQTREKNLHFISCGPLPPNPAELLGGEGMKDLLRAARAQYDHVVIDGPPVLGFADAPLLASIVEGTLFVVQSRGTRRGQARGALRRLAQGRGRILGVVLTKFNTKAATYGDYNYTYDYHYGPNTSGSPKKKGAFGSRGS